MAVIGTAKERQDSPQANFEANKHTITRKFLVQTSDVQDGPITVTAAIGIPLMFSLYSTPHEIQKYARVRSIDAQRIEPRSLFWEVTVRYETPEPYSGEQGSPREVAGQDNNPLLVIPEIETHSEQYQQAIYGIYDPVTQTFKPCAASTGEVFDPPPMRDASRLILTITRNEIITAPHPATANLYIDNVNSDVFFGAAPGQVKCMGISTSKQTKQLSGGSVYTYLKCVYTFQFRPTWDLQILNAGNYYYTSMVIPRKKYKFITEEGHPRQGLLDVNGLALPDGGTPVFLTIRPYFRKPFGLLNLPQSFLAAS